MKAQTSFTTKAATRGPLHPGQHGRALLLFMLRVAAASAFGLGLALIALSMNGCAVQHSPVPAVVTVCPHIPVPAKPQAPHVVLPAQDGEGRYCLTQQQVNELAAGIKALRLYAEQLTAAVDIFNGASRPGELPPDGSSIR